MKTNEELLIELLEEEIEFLDGLMNVKDMQIPMSKVDTSVDSMERLSKLIERRGVLNARLYGFRKKD